MKLLAAGLCLAMLLAPAVASAQDPPSSPGAVPAYPFLLLDSPPHYFTMREIDLNYVTGYRLFASYLNAHTRPAVSFLLQSTACLVLLKTMTHEEAHQSVLTAEGIDAGSRFFLFMPRSGFVDGVTDATLEHLRDTKFPTFLRLHTAGFESDFMIAWREEGLLSFGQEPYRNLAVDYLLRKFALVFYFTEGYFRRNSDAAEEPNELDRDVVGNDLYSAIRHLYRPDMPYYRYTRFQDLTDEEHQYLDRVQKRTFLNLANVNIAGLSGFKLRDDLRANVAMAHCMGPFGDFIDERFWLAWRNRWHVSGYVREFENQDHWFMGGGAGVEDIVVRRRLTASATLHYWKQPADLSFTSGTGKSGGAVDLAARYRVVSRPGGGVSSWSIDVGVLGKTAGFLPEEMALDAHVGVRLGITLGLHGN
jgi:hypothetical protein